MLANSQELSLKSLLLRKLKYIYLLAVGGAAFCLLSACASAPYMEADSKVFYKRDMKLNVNGFKGDGVLVVPKADKYSFDVKAKGDLDLFTMDTCHREETKEDVGEGLFKDDKRAKFDYKPGNNIESSSACPVRLGGYERANGRHSWAYIDFETDDAKLPALVKCNGNTYNSRGVTICQSKVGLIQEIIFPEETIVNPAPGCEMPRPADLKTYRFNMSARECVFNFMEKKKPNREHRLSTIGYEAVLLRKN